jgi:hypothetical protein
MKQFGLSEKEYVALSAPLGEKVTLADYRAAQAREKGKK